MFHTTLRARTANSYQPAESSNVGRHSPTSTQRSAGPRSHFDLWVREAGHPQEARRAISTILARTGVAAVDQSVVYAALMTELPDFEDAVLQQAAIAAGLDAVVTRNPTDFDADVLSVYTPAELSATLLSSG